MNLLELVDKRGLRIKDLESLTNKIVVEHRKFDESETTDFNKIKEDIKNIEKMIEDVKNEDKRNNSILKNNEKNNMNNETKFSLLKAINARVSGRMLDEVTLDVINQGQEEMRKAGLSFSGDIQLPLSYRANIVAGVDGAGQDFINEDKIGLIEPLRNKLVLVNAGATFLSGLRGDVSVPAYGGTSALWKGEVVAAVDGAGATSEVTLSPKRLTCFIDVSKQFLLQDTVGAEAMLMNDIVRAISDKLETTVFGADVETTTQPGGFFNIAPTIVTGTTFAGMVQMETSIGSANIDYTKAAYICNAAGRGKLKSTVKVAGYPNYILEGTEMNGYPVLVSNCVGTVVGTGAGTGVTSGIVFGDWSQFLVGQWGSIDIVVDGLSQAINGNVRIVVNAYFDAKPRIAGAFKTGYLN